MNDDLDPQTPGEKIGCFAHRRLYGPPRRCTPELVDQVIMGLPLLSRIVLLERRYGRTNWQIAWKYRMTPRRVVKEYARALTGLVRGFQSFEWPD